MKRNREMYERRKILNNNNNNNDKLDEIKPIAASNTKGGYVES